MRLLLALCLLVLVAALASSRWVWTLGRMRLFAILSSGGWLAYLLGLLLGPTGMSVLNRDDLYTLNHIAIFCLGWVGLNIGLQIRPGIIARLNRPVVVTVAWDTLLSLLPLSALFYLFLDSLIITSDWSSLFIALLLGVCSIGWLGEMRSLRIVGLAGKGQLRSYLAATSGLASIVAVLCFGLLLEFFAIGGPQSTGWTRPGGFVTGLSIPILLALLVGALAKYLLKLAGKARSDFLLVLVGLVTLPSATALVMGYSPMFLSMLSGAAIGNIARKDSLRLQSLLLDGERLIATGLMLIAGMVSDPAIGLPGALLVIAVLAARACTKWLSVSPLCLQGVPMASRARRYVGAVRQSYLAPVFVLSLCSIIEAGVTPRPLHLERLLTTVALIGLLSHLLPALGIVIYRNRSSTKA